MACPPTVNNLTINNSGGNVTLAASVTVNGALTLTSGDIVAGANQVILASAASVSGASTSSYVNGTVQKAFGSTGGGQSFTFPIGNASNYLPLSLASMNVTHAGNLTVNTTTGNHPNISTSGIDSAHSVNRYWTLTPGGSFAATYNATFNYLATDVDSGATPSQFIANLYSSGAWTAATVSGTPTSTATTISGATGFGDFAIGDPKASQTITFNSPGNQTYSVAPITLTATASSGLTVGYTVPAGPAGVTNNVLTINGAGSVTIVASQPGNAN